MEICKDSQGVKQAEVLMVMDALVVERERSFTCDPIST